MSRRLFELAVRARRLVTRTTRPRSKTPKRTRLTARRQVGQELTQFSFRLAFLIDIAYVGVGALAGAAVGRAASSHMPPSVERAGASCTDTVRAGPVAR